MEPETQLVADAYGGQGSRGVEEMAVGGLAPITTQPVEAITDLGDEYPGTRQRGQPVHLPVALDAHANTGDQLFREDLTELSCLHQRGVGMGEHRGFRRGAVQREQRLMSVEDPEVR
ncbi:hypothetical protein [Streptomyces sp. DSM 40907]|uniref:hypothetical protein n=1 Tax=Streptomyces kutzneri TaxID=3051179 RepID=UPI0028D3F5F1|nr:hypothetical protein [Streptomyces sp. DSM 40907]